MTSVGDKVIATASITVVSFLTSIKGKARIRLEVSENKDVIFFPSKFTDLLASISLIILPSRKQPEALEGEGQLRWIWGLALTGAHWVAFQSSLPASGPLLHGRKEVTLRHSSQSLALCLSPETARATSGAVFNLLTHV